MRRKIWSTKDATETMRIQNYREMGPNMIARGENEPAGGDADKITRDLLLEAREFGGEGGGAPG